MQQNVRGSGDGKDKRSHERHGEDAPAAATTTRRALLVAASGGAAGLLLAGCAPQIGRSRAQGPDPFTLGIASGYPTPEGFVLWTRLAPEAPGLVATVPVQWEVAEDEGMRRIVR